MRPKVPTFLSDSDVAEMLGVSVATVQRWRKSGKDGPRYCRIGAGTGTIRYRPEDVAGYIESRLSGREEDESRR